MEEIEPSEFTKKCQLVKEALNDVINNIHSGKQFRSTLIDASNILKYLAIPEGSFIGRSNMKCLLIKEEDEALIVDQETHEDLELRLRPIKSFFDAIDEMGITRINKEVYGFVMNECFEEDEEEIEKQIEFLKKSGFDETALETYRELSTLKSTYKSKIEEIMEVRPDYFEMGKPELEVMCNEQCRGTAVATERQTFETGALRSIVGFQRPDNCLYKDWL